MQRIEKNINLNAEFIKYNILDVDMLHNVSLYPQNKSVYSQLRRLLGLLLRLSRLALGSVQCLSRLALGSVQGIHLWDPGIWVDPMWTTHSW